MREASRLPRYEGAGKLPILGNLTEGVCRFKKYTPPVSYADIPLKTRGTRAATLPKYCDKQEFSAVAKYRPPGGRWILPLKAKAKDG